MKMNLKLTSRADLYLVHGKVPHYHEMVNLSRYILKLMIEDLGLDETVRRFSNAAWFQCLASVLGMEWYTSGSTTVVFKALKEASIKENLPIKFLGGKGKDAINIQKEIEKYDLDGKFKEISIITVKTDNALIQDSFQIYFHGMIIGEKEYVVINQGMNEKERLVRRYHWLSPEDFREDHFKSETNKVTLNLAHRKIEETRKAILDLLQEPIERIQRYFITVKNTLENRTLSEYFENIKIIRLPYYLKLPKKLDLKVIEKAREVIEFKELLKIKGLGPATFRALALIASIIYGEPLYWEKPEIYSYAHGTKSGKPYFVNKKLMLESAEILKEIIEKLPKEYRVKAMRRLARTTGAAGI